jgi:hypothetical protein
MMLQHTEPLTLASDIAGPIIMGATGHIQGTFLNIGASALIVGAVVLALRKGWSMFRNMIDGPSTPYRGEDYSGRDNY